MMIRASKLDMRKLAGGIARAGVSYAEGDVMYAKIDNVKLLAAPHDAAKVVVFLKKPDQLVFLGEVQDGFVKVQSSTAVGWVRKTLVAKR
jgi:SH3-like domain-containing protein